MRGAAIGAAALLLWSSAATGQIDVDNRGVTVDPSGEASPEYGRSIEERNRREARGGGAQGRDAYRHDLRAVRAGRGGGGRPAVAAGVAGAAG